MEITIVLLSGIILYCFAINIKLREKLWKATNLIEKFQHNKIMDNEAVVTLTWYVQKSVLLSKRYEQYKEALKWFHNTSRLQEEHLLNKINQMSHQEFMSYLHEKGIFSQNWYEREKMLPVVLSLQEAMNELRRVRQNKGLEKVEKT